MLGEHGEIALRSLGKRFSRVLRLTKQPLNLPYQIPPSTLCRLHGLPREHQLTSVVTTETEVAIVQSIEPLTFQNRKREELPLRLRHLPCFIDQKLAMNPVTDPLLSCRRFALSDLVRMMYRNMIDSSTVNIE